MNKNDRIEGLLQQFAEETYLMSSVDQWLLTEPGQALLAYGDDVVKHIFNKRRMLNIRDIVLLHKITGQNPVTEEHHGRVSEMSDHWLRWGREHGYCA